MSYTQHKNNNSAAANKAINKLSKQSKGTLGTRLAGEQFATNKKGKLKQTVAPKPVLTTSSKLHPSSLNNANFKRVKQILVKWVNSLIAKRKLQITDVTNDMADGLMFACILEELTGEHIVEWQTTTSEKGKGKSAYSNLSRHELCQSRALFARLLEHPGRPRLMDKSWRAYPRPVQRPRAPRAHLPRRRRKPEPSVQSVNCRHEELARGRRHEKQDKCTQNHPRRE